MPAMGYSILMRESWQVAEADIILLEAENDSGPADR